MASRTIFFAALIAAILDAPSANAETYVCQIRSNGPDMGLVSDTIAINIDDVTSEVMVSDAIILATNNRPIAAVLTVNTRKRLAIKWGVQGVKDAKSRVYNHLNYKLIIWKSRGNKVSVAARDYTLAGTTSVGGSRGWEVSGSGKCKLR